MKLLLLLSIFFAISCSADKNKDQNKAALLTESALLHSNYSSLKNSKSMKEILCQCWENKEDMEDVDEVGFNSDIDMLLRGYCFYQDGRFIKYPRGYMQKGTWQLNEQSRPVSISLKMDNGTDKLDLAMLTPTIFKFKVDDKLQEYTGTAMKFVNDMNDPFYPVNNEWRIRPARPESPEQIKKRLKACIHFFVLFYNHAINTNVPVVLFGGLPSCFVWYSGGIYMQKKDELPQKWIDCFYDKADAMKAYALAGKVMRKKYIWPEGEKSWLKLNVAVLKQMEQQIDSIN